MALSLRFYIDPETGDPHIYNHGVEEQEVEDVIILPNEDRRGREGSRIAIGQTQKGVISEWFTFAAVTRTTYLWSLPTNCEATL